MTVREAFANFTNSQARVIGGADYAVESFLDNAILTLTPKGFLEIKNDPETNEVTEKKITLAAAKLEHADEILTVSGSNKKITIACSTYDYRKITGHLERLKAQPKEDE